MKPFVFTLGCFLLCLAPAGAREPIRLANHPALSPDGALLAFDWNGDIWVASSAGGAARQITSHPARDTQPKFSPDGKNLAFISDREGTPQVFIVPVQGGAPRQLTQHSAGFSLGEWTPDGRQLLVRAARDHFWRHAERFFLIDAKEPSQEQLLFDDYGADGILSPDGQKVLFTREGEGWWRKGYQGSRVSQVWSYDRKTQDFTKLLPRPFGSRWPLWQPDGKGLYYVGEHARGANLFAYDPAAKSSRQLTTFKDDSVVFPCIARDGSLLAFRHLFDLYTVRPDTGVMKKLDLWHEADRVGKKTEQRLLTTATTAAFTRDGLEIAFSAGGDLWVMDTELREPRPITKTADEEAEPLFASDGDTLYFASGAGDRFGLWQATRQDPKKYWWQNQSFQVSKILDLDQSASRLKLSPDGKKLAYVRGRGDLCVLDLESRASKTILAGWNAPDYDWSPDGTWFVYAALDADFNRDVYLLPADGTGQPYNVSRHPFNEGAPVWSPDGKKIAFTGRRANEEGLGANVCLVYLRKEDDEKTSLDRKLEKALEKMKGRVKGGTKTGDDKQPKDGKDEPKTTMPVVIDFEGLHERVQRISLGDGAATALFWSPDSKKLAFTGSWESKTGTYAIDIGDNLVPKLLTPTVGSNPVWLKQGNQIVWLVGGVPTSTSAASPVVASTPPGVTTPAPGPAPKKGPLPAAVPKLDGASAGGSYTFSARQQVDWPARRALIFDLCWRIMRDHWYDANLGNNDWNAVRQKYRDQAAAAPDLETVQTLVQMMLGELNGSHLGFTLNPSDPKKTDPRDVTAHLGVRFDLAFVGPGLKIRDVLPGGPADKKRSRLLAGEVLLKIDGVEVGPKTDLATVLNGPLDREIVLLVQGGDGKTRDVALRPITYQAAQGLLYNHWLRHNRKLVAEASGGKLGYLHISAMSMPTFRKFEEELVSEGVGKDGLIIDVRENPGGSTADHLLTALTQPVHAITVPRGGGPGYPQDRKVYVSWHKPIVVLCNQNSGSNAEIFSHAVKTLKRGQLVGIPTAGAVVSTGTTPILDVGALRLPTRGWFTIGDGEDMEKHGAVPHHLLWLAPGQLPQGRDAQLNKALEVLRADVEIWRERPQLKLLKATEREKR